MARWTDVYGGVESFDSPDGRRVQVTLGGRTPRGTLYGQRIELEEARWRVHWREILDRMVRDLGVMLDGE